MLKSTISKRRDRKSAFEFIKRPMKRHVQRSIIVTDRLRQSRADMISIGNAGRQETGRWINNRTENFHLPFRRRERVVLKFRRGPTLQKFAVAHASTHKHINQERRLHSCLGFKISGTAAFVECRQLLSA